jgi:arylsulfatase A
VELEGKILRRPGHPHRQRCRRVLLDLLKELGIDDNTLVIISGDNGSSFAPNSPIGKRFNQAANGLRGFKRSLYEGALRQACIARWPGKVPAGRVSRRTLGVLGLPAHRRRTRRGHHPAECKTDGLSLVSHLKGGPLPKRDSFYWELHERTPIQAVRFGDWKAVKNGPKSEIELYDLAKDPGEKQNIAAGHPEQVAKAKGLMAAGHKPSPDWPLTGISAQRLADRNKPSGKQK